MKPGRKKGLSQEAGACLAKAETRKGLRWTQTKKSILAASVEEKCSEVEEKKRREGGRPTKKKGK